MALPRVLPVPAREIWIKPNELVRKVHDRMPTILAPFERRSLAIRDEPPWEVVRSILKQHDAMKMRVQNISMRLSNTPDVLRCDDPVQHAGAVMAALNACGLIIEGVTGAGKTSTIKALQSIVSFDLIDEHATFNDFMSEFFADPEPASRRARERLDGILDRVEADKSRRHLMERFHFSQLALGSDWKWYRDLDDRCATLGCKVVVLVLPEEHLGSRSLYRAEYEGKDWQEFIQRYGSEGGALDAIRRSQKARLEAVKESRLESRLIDTRGKDWSAYAKLIAEWAGWVPDPTASIPKQRKTKNFAR